MTIDIASLLGVSSPEQAAAQACVYLIFMYAIARIDVKDDRILETLLLGGWGACAAVALLSIMSITQFPTTEEFSFTVLVLMVLSLFVVFESVFSVKPKEVRRLRERVEKMEVYEAHAWSTIIAEHIQKRNAGIRDALAGADDPEILKNHPEMGHKEEEA